MSTTTTTTTTTTMTTRDRGDRYGPMEWAQIPPMKRSANVLTSYHSHPSSVLLVSRSSATLHMLIHPWTTAEPSGPVWPPYQGTGTTDQADLVQLGSAQLNLMSLHSTIVYQLSIIEQNIDTHGERSWQRQPTSDMMMMMMMIEYDKRNNRDSYQILFKNKSQQVLIVSCTQ